MPSPNLQLTGGSFQNAVGTVIANGTLQLTLSHDEEYVAGSSQIVAGLKAQAQLNAQGNIPNSPALMVYSNDSLLPAGSYYIVELFDIKGNKLWQQFWTLAASPNPLNVGTIVPISPPGSGLSGGNASNILLQTNEVNNGSQSLLDLHAGANITLADNGLGQITITGGGGGGSVLTATVPLSTADLTNLRATPKTLVAGQAGKTIVPLFYQLVYTFGTIPFSGATSNVFNVFPGTSITLAWDNGIHATGFVDQSSNLICFAAQSAPNNQQAFPAPQTLASFQNQALSLGFGASQGPAPLSAGNGTVTAIVAYMVI